MLRVLHDGAHTRILSTLCTRCPQGSTGCCAAPPVVAWADLARIVVLGGRDWLLAELSAGRLHPCPRGLAIRRVKNEAADAFDAHAPKKCTYHGPEGCTVPEDRRSATCNYYVCDDAFAHHASEEGRGEPSRTRKLHDRLTMQYADWDLFVGARVLEAHPSGPKWDAAFLDALGEELREELQRSSLRTPAKTASESGPSSTDSPAGTSTVDTRE